ncbi:ABC transporter substrate-binding protein [Paenibacillus sepulcri]|uniref:ABC transporter substrate-binding protein n=1 Tax=Paenibacillus sepulcri TaxID=359917 RepID=A0ABS7C1P8_9BACL|nr:ABC transporter substrate-binding protein [Paenibacillus sepulcri]
MKNKKRSMAAQLVALLLCFTVLAACGNNNNSGGTNGANTPDTPKNSANTPNNAGTTTEKNEEPAVPALDEAKLTFYYPVSSAPGKDQKLVNDEINKYLKEKINATVELKPLTFDEYEPKLNAIMAAGEEFDIAWSARGWLLNYQPNIDKGAFLELTDDMISNYAPEARANIPDKFWPDLKANDGKVYGFPVYQIAAKQKSLVIQKRYADKYLDLDVNTIHSYKDFEPFFKAVKENEPDVIPMGMAQNSWGLYVDPNVIFSDGLGVMYAKDDATYKAIPTLQSIEDKKDFYATMHDWYQAGYINEDAPILGNINDLKKKGNVAAVLDFVTKPGGEVDEMNNNGGNEVVRVPLSESYFTGVASAMHIVSKTSKNPERALMLINLLNTDKYLYNLICNGIEGTHYTKKDDAYIEPIKDSGYAPNVDWVFGNQFNAYLKAPQAADVWEKTIALNESALVPVSYGFSRNDDAIKSEVANTLAVNNEYQVAIETGAVDPAKEVPEYINKLKASGQEKIDQETDKQWEAFLTDKGL